MSEHIWVNGKIMPAKAPVISGMDRGFLLGEGVFETMAVVNGIIWKLDRHTRRMQQGLDGLSIPSSITQDGIRDMLENLRAYTDLEHGVLRVTVSSGAGGRGLIPEIKSEPTVIASYQPVPEILSGGITAFCASTRRNHRSATCQWKVIPNLDQLLATREARHNGFQEAIMFNTDDRLCGFGSGNIILWDGETLCYPDASSGALPGTTLDLLLAKNSSSMPIQASAWHKDDMDRVKGLYKTSSLTGIVPVSMLDHRPLGSMDLPVLASIQQSLREDVVLTCGAFEGRGILPWLKD